MPAFLIPLPDWPLRDDLRLDSPLIAQSMQRQAAGDALLQSGDIPLQPKSEHHLTLANSALVAELQRAVPGDALSWLQAQWEAGDTRILGTGQYTLLHKRPDRAPHVSGSWSVVETVIVPGQEAFLRRVERQLGRQLPRPPAHVTTHVAGRARGIGVPRPALLRRYIRHAVCREIPTGDDRGRGPDTDAVTDSASYVQQSFTLR